MNIYEGILGHAIHASANSRLKLLIRDEESEALRMFHPEKREELVSGDWLGEHAGKWLCAASLAVRRTGDEALKAALNRTCDLLIQYQEPSGYLGTYARASAARFTHSDAATVRSWDVWIHSWIILGLLAAHKVLQRADILCSATKIGDLVWTQFSGKANNLVTIGNHEGLSSAVIIHPLAELTCQTHDAKYANLAEEILLALDQRGTRLLTGRDHALDASEVGTGKIYQLCWVLLGLVRLSEVRDRRDLLGIAEYWWSNLVEQHLTPLGGPWGGVGVHKEVFNPAGFFEREGLTETCSTVTWISLCRELHRLTGRSLYYDAAEVSVYNSLLGAIDANCSDWCYFTFPNGRRNNTYYWACCKSSGALGLEEIALWDLSPPNEIVINRWENQICSDGDIRVSRSIGNTWMLTVENVSEHEKSVKVRVPRWAELTSHQASDGWLTLTLPPSHTVELLAHVPMRVTPYRSTTDHHGQIIQSRDYIYVSLGPYVYATGLIDGYKTSEVFRIAKLFPESSFRVDYENSPDDLPNIWLLETGRDPVLMRPYYEAGGRHDGAWRATWLEVAWQ